MKIVTVLVFLAFSLSALGQPTAMTGDWVRTTAVYNDGHPVPQRSAANVYLRYAFDKKEVYTILELLTDKRPFTYQGDIFTLGTFQKFIVEKFSDDELILLETGDLQGKT